MPLTDSQAQRLNMSMPVANDIKLGDFLKSLESGEGSVADGSITTTKLADGAVTEAKLQTVLSTKINSKLTANKVANQPHSTATDVAGVVADLNSLIDKLVAAGVMSS